MSVSRESFSDISQILSLYRVDQDTVSTIKSFSTEAQSLIPQFLEDVQEWFTAVNACQVITKNKQTQQEFVDKKKHYWKEFFNAHIDEEYINSRLEMGNYYSRINLPLNDYCALISYKLSWWDNAVEKSLKEHKKKVSESIQRLILLDTGATCVAYTNANNQLIEEQNHSLLQLSTPTIQLLEGILLLPIVGVLDSVRSQNMMEELLQRTAQTSSPVSIIDIVGVPNVDSSVANHLIKIVRATKLLGSTCILSGISPEVAQTLVEVGVDLEGIKTTSNLQNALKFGLDILKMTIKPKEDNNGH